MPGWVHEDLRTRNGHLSAPPSIASNYRRIIAVILAAALQLAFASIFVIRIHVDRNNKRLQQELIFIIPSEQQPARAQPKAERPVGLPDEAYVTPAFKFLPTPEANVAPVSPEALQRFGAALFGCAPENYQKLSPEMRVRCPVLSGREPIPNAPNLM